MPFELLDRWNRATTVIGTVHLNWLESSDSVLPGRAAFLRTADRIASVVAAHCCTFSATNALARPGTSNRLVGKIVADRTEYVLADPLGVLDVIDA